jgi:hypothetical protein
MFSGFSKTAFTIEKIALFAPMPIASVATAASVKLGFCRNMRKDCFSSPKKARIGSTLLFTSNMD